MSSLEVDKSATNVSEKLLSFVSFFFFGEKIVLVLHIHYTVYP